MLKQRRDAAQAVASEFLKAETAVDEAAQSAAACVSTMLFQRSAAKLPVGTGLVALRMIHSLSEDLLNLRERFVEAHRVLAQVRDEIGLSSMFGDEIPCPEGSIRPAESRPHLAAVA